MKAPYLPGKAVSAAILLAALFAAATVSAADTERTTESTHYSSGGRDAREAIKTERETRETSATTSKSRTTGVSKTSQSAARSVSNDFWFYSADVVLFGDEDFDGYYSGIDLLFDADTIYAEADVYAVLFLSFNGADWEEYAVTETFTLFGSSPNDDYSVVTDLVAGFPTGSYDLLIELYDAWNDDFLAYIGPDDTSELSFLPLEDINNDTPIGPDTTVVINTEGGGSASLALLLGLAGAIALRRRAGHRRA